MVVATVICGSGNPEGVSREMCSIAESILKARGYDVFFFNPADMDISHCNDCGGCRSGNCVIEDDMESIYDAFSVSEIMIFSSPIHFSGPSSVIKTVMDRFQKCWFDTESSHPSRFIALLCGGSLIPNFEMTEKIYKAFCITTRMEYCGALEIPHTDSGVQGLEEKVSAFISDKV